MDEVEREIVAILASVLGPNVGRSALNASSPLLGAVAELDSMAVVGVLTAIEERFGVGVADDEIDGATFASVGSLSEFVRAKLRG